jgi:protease I
MSTSPSPNQIINATCWHGFLSFGLKTIHLLIKKGNKMSKLSNKKVAILLTDGFEEIEFTEPKKALEEAGAEVSVIAPDSGKVKAWAKTNWGNEYDVTLPLDQAKPADYDALMLPGGVMNPDKLRMNSLAVQFARDFIDKGKPIAAICHAPQLLIETGTMKGRKLTSYPSLKTDLTNAGANWVDEAVVIDRGLVTSRNPGDLEVFNKNMVEEFSEGKHS